MLQQQGSYNDLSPKLREKLEKRIEGFGKTVRYKFNLERNNPDPQKHDGAIIFPAMYNLDPIQWKITDNDEDRKDKQKVKNIGVISETTIDDRGVPRYKFTRVRLTSGQRGVMVLDSEIPEQLDMIAALELHPKNGNGMFPNPQMIPIFSRVDESKLATEKRTERTHRKKALDAAEAMSDAEVVEFADAMTWDSTRDISLLRNEIEELAEHNPTLFNDLINSKKMKIQSMLKKAIDQRILSYNPAECSLAWASTQQNIITLGLGDGSIKDLERLAEWFDTAGKKAQDVEKKVKTLIEKPVSV